MKQFIYTFGFEENLRPYVFGCKNHKEFLKRLLDSTPMGFMCDNHTELIDRLKWLFVSKDQKVKSEEHLLQLMTEIGVLKIKEVRNGTN